MKNKYQKHLLKFFDILTDFKHTTNRLNKVLLKDVELYTTEGATYFSGTALVISDWTGQTDNGWKKKFPTGVQKSTLKETYAVEIEKVLSREFGLAYAQCYEAFETLLKDLTYEKIFSDQKFVKLLDPKKNYSRESLRGGDEIFKLIKKAGGPSFSKYSKDNNHNFRFKELFEVLSEVRHAITHSQGELKTEKIPNNKYHRQLFEHLFELNKINGELLYLKLDYKTLDQLIVYLAEFGFQIFKILSEEDKCDWKI